MKKTIAITLVAAAAFASAAEVKLQDIRPDAATAPAALTGAEWQVTNAVALAEATADEKLAAFVVDAAAAEALLSKLGGAYRTDPVVAFQIGAVTQWTMGEDPCFLFFWRPSPSAGRRVWTEALLARAASATCDDYVRTFCLDQLRWCGYQCAGFAARVRAAGASAPKAVCEFSDVVANELEGKAIGL